MTTLFWGDRVGRVRDPRGNVWWIQEHVGDIAPEELARRAQAPTFRDAMRYVQTSLSHELSRRGTAAGERGALSPFRDWRYWRRLYSFRPADRVQLTHRQQAWSTPLPTGHPDERGYI
jgi:hypothetical protein